MILSILTGGIDLPKLASDVADTRSAIDKASTQGRPHLGPTATVADVIYWLRCRIEKLENLIASRALAEDVETLRLKLERVGWEVERPDAGHMSMVEGTPTLATEVAQLKASNAILHVSVDALSAKVEALTAAKLSEVKARKAPKKDAAK